MNNIRVKSIWIILAIIVCVVLFVYKLQPSEEDMKIQHKKERMVQYVIEKVELHDKEEFKKIKVIEFKKNYSTGAWRGIIELNQKYRIVLKEERFGEDIRTTSYNPDELDFKDEGINYNNSKNIVIEYNQQGSYKDTDLNYKGISLDSYKYSFAIENRENNINYYEIISNSKEDIKNEE